MQKHFPAERMLKFLEKQKQKPMWKCTSSMDPLNQCAASLQMTAAVKSDTDLSSWHSVAPNELWLYMKYMTFMIKDLCHYYIFFETND